VDLTEGVDWINLAHGPLMCSCEHGNEPSGSIKGGELISLAVISVSRTVHHGVNQLLNCCIITSRNIVLS
jgi:hypothetical protein